ncbi:hypothetical protein ACDT12_13295 [Staphylococcus aureus]
MEEDFDYNSIKEVHNAINKYEVQYAINDEIDYMESGDESDDGDETHQGQDDGEEDDDVVDEVGEALLSHIKNKVNAEHVDSDECDENINNMFGDISDDEEDIKQVSGGATKHKFDEDCENIFGFEDRSTILSSFSLINESKGSTFLSIFSSGSIYFMISHY